MEAVNLTKKSSTLAEKQWEMTRGLILSTSVELLEKCSVNELTVRAVADEAGISERTIFRYFSTREVFLDAVASTLFKSLGTPPPPRTLKDLLRAPDVLYRTFEAKSTLVKIALHPDFYHRIRLSGGQQRWDAIQVLINEIAPQAPQRRRKLIAGHIRYLLSATSWHYFRFYFGFTIEEAIECAEISLSQGISALTLKK